MPMTLAWRVLAIILLSVHVALAADASNESPEGVHQAPIAVVVDTRKPSTPFPHYWEQMFGSGRAALALRDSYRQDVRLVKSVVDFKYVRFHAIFHDEIGLYDVDAAGKAVYNFSYIDQIYDGLLALGVRPFVELSFMPKKLARDPNNIFGFWYQPYISEPKDYAQWDAMLQAFAQHLIERYGIEEVAQWYFEVWNEPNGGFWGGKPYQPTYFELYDHSARALKAISRRLRVGGPSTAQAAWVQDFIQHCHEHHVPVDFVSSHVYANDDPQDVFGNTIPVPRDQMVCRAVRKVHDEIQRSPLPAVPLIWSEYNASYANEPNVTDTVYMGPWLAATISQCDGLTEAMSYWTFSDVFEENGVVKSTFYGGFGLLAEDNIPKPAFNAFALLHRLGDRRLSVDSDAALITQRRDGTLVVALWNYAPPDGTGAKYTPAGSSRRPKTFLLQLKQTGLLKRPEPLKRPAPAARARVWRLDADHGNVMKAYDALDRPVHPTPAQLPQLKKAAQLPSPENLRINDGRLSLEIPAQGLVLIEIR